MERVGIVGLGNMGMGMAKNFLQSGYVLTAYDIRDEPLQEISRLGARTAASPKEVGENASVVFVMVLNGPQVAAVVLGEQGLIETMNPDSTIICTATIERSIMIAVADAAEAKGIHIVDSPVSGGQPGASAGTLTMMVAAKKDVFENCKKVLSAVGQHIYHVGEEIGMGQTVKAALTALTGSSYGGIFEALVLGAKLGVDPEVLLIFIKAVGSVGSSKEKEINENKKIDDGNKCHECE